MFVLMVRTFLVYFCIVFSMRMMGKKQLGELQPSELVSTILISNLASICIESPEIPLLGSIVPVLLIVCIEIVLSCFSLRHRGLSLLISGRPKILIRSGRIDQRTLRELRFTADDVMEALRGKDIFDLADVELAIVETNGSISVCKRAGAENVCRDDLLLKEPKAKKPRIPVILMGEYDTEAMNYVGLTQKELAGMLAENRCAVSDVLLLLCNDAHDYRLVKKEG